ncbi:MAG: hypothetical protein ACK4IX_06845 [Candidatus Sericytochromatia bacterium]
MYLDGSLPFLHELLFNELLLFADSEGLISGYSEDKIYSLTIYEYIKIVEYAITVSKLKISRIYYRKLKEKLEELKQKKGEGYKFSNKEMREFVIDFLESQDILYNRIQVLYDKLIEILSRYLYR